MAQQSTMRIFLFFLFLNSFYPSLRADDYSFESWNNKQSENYPFECVEDGATPEYTRCSAETLNKYDWELRKELNDDKLWNEWRNARDGICYHYQTKYFGQGTVKPLMSIACQQRLNSEAKRYCITGEDKQCG